MNLRTLILSTVVMYTSGFRIMCYYTNSGPHSAGMVSFQSRHWDPLLCTHLVYSHARVSGLTLSPTHPSDVSTETQVGMYSQIQVLKKSNPKLKVLLGVGGLMEKSDSFIAAASSDSSRRVFARSVAMFLVRRKFDGAQMEWANLAADTNPRYDKNKFVLLLKELRKEFNEVSRYYKTGLILAVTLPAVKSHIDRGYKIPQLVMETDFITVRALDLRTASDGKVGLSAPLRSHPKAVGDDRYLNVEWIANYYLSLKVPKEKISIGVPTFGQSFVLKNESMNEIGAAAGHLESSFINTSIMGYFQVCRQVRGAGSVVHVAAQGGRYYTSGSLWLSYEDILSVTQKTCFIRKLGLGGMTFFTLNLDDFTGMACLHGSYPLIRTAVNLMTYEHPGICSETNLTRYVDVPSPVSATPNRPPMPTQAVKRIVCYYTIWAQHRQGKARFVPEDIDPNLCTHIVYAYGVFKDLTIVPYYENDKSKPWIEGMYGRVVRLKKLNPNLKVLLGVGGGSAAYNIGDQIADSSGLVELAKSTAIFLEENQFDGLEVTWQEPSSRWKANFAYFIQILRSAFGNHVAFHGQPRLLLSLAMVNAKAKIDSGYGDEISRIAASVDFISLMTYDFHGSEDARTGHNSPLFPMPTDYNDERYRNVDWVANYYVTLGVPKHKLDIGIASYGRSFTLHNPNDHWIKSPATGPGRPGKFTTTPGLLAYYEVCDFISSGANVSYVPYQRVSYAFCDTQWVGFDDAKSVVEKACYAVTNGFGGVNVRTVDYDDVTGEFCNLGEYPLLRIINITLTNAKQVCAKFL